MSIRMARSDDEITACFPVMVQLRPHLRPADFLPRIREQEAGGYRLAFLEADGRIATVAGFRFFQKLSPGHVLYVDDLVTDRDARSRGHGARMLAWLRAHAIEQSCSNFQLDCGVQRKDSHRFYQREGLTLSAYHFDAHIVIPGAT